MVNGIPDETYWSTLANLHGHPITGALTTYMEPGDPKTGHSKMFTEVGQTARARLLIALSDRSPALRAIAIAMHAPLRTIAVRARRRAGGRGAVVGAASAVLLCAQVPDHAAR